MEMPSKSSGAQDQSKAIEVDMSVLERVPANHIPLYALEAEVLRQPQVELPVFHDFCDGLYARTMFIPAGVVLTGAVHKHESFFIVRSGRLAVTDGLSEAMEVSGGFMAVTPAGTKRAGYAITDVYVTTFHANPQEIRDEKEIWDTFTIAAPDGIHEALEEGVRRLLA